MIIKTFTIKHHDGRTEEFQIARNAWGSLTDQDGHFDIKREVARRFSAWDAVVLTDNPAKFYHVVDGYNAPGCATIARVSVA